MHAIVAAGATVMLMKVYTFWLTLFFLAVAWVCWSPGRTQGPHRRTGNDGAVVGIGGGVYTALAATLA